MDKKFLTIAGSVALASFLIRCLLSPAQTNSVSVWLRANGIF